jgi:hypothetical protein
LPVLLAINHIEGVIYVHCITLLCKQKVFYKGVDFNGQRFGGNSEQSSGD